MSCTMAIEFLEQLEDDAARSLAPPPFQTRPPPPSLDPSTKLLAAAQRDDANAIKACLAEGLDPSYGNSLGQTALHIAAMWGNANALDALIAAGANVNAQNQLSAASPLHIAASSIKAAPGRLACAARLLEAGADARLLDEDGDASSGARRRLPRELRALLQTAFERAAASSVLRRGVMWPPSCCGCFFLGGYRCRKAAGVPTTGIAIPAGCRAAFRNKGWNCEQRAISFETAVIRLEGEARRRGCSLRGRRRRDVPLDHARASLCRHRAGRL